MASAAGSGILYLIQQTLPGSQGESLDGLAPEPQDLICWPPSQEDSPRAWAFGPQVRITLCSTLKGNC